MDLPGTEQVSRSGNDALGTSTGYLLASTPGCNLLLRLATKGPLGLITPNEQIQALTIEVSNCKNPAWFP